MMEQQNDSIGVNMFYSSIYNKLRYTSNRRSRFVRQRVAMTGTNYIVCNIFFLKLLYLNRKDRQKFWHDMKSEPAVHFMSWRYIIGGF